ncbi:hypothetical protein MMC14_008628 [Varicellaria rhodocarpa]|nr:hypothetical protein [Varicellaria rhodocarpa]
MLVKTITLSKKSNRIRIAFEQLPSISPDSHSNSPFHTLEVSVPPVTVIIHKAAIPIPPFYHSRHSTISRPTLSLLRDKHDSAHAHAHAYFDDNGGGGGGPDCDESLHDSDDDDDHDSDDNAHPDVLLLHDIPASPPPSTVPSPPPSPTSSSSTSSSTSSPSYPLLNLPLLLAFLPIPLSPRFPLVASTPDVPLVPTNIDTFVVSVTAAALVSVAVALFVSGVVAELPAGAVAVAVTLFVSRVVAGEEAYLVAVVVGTGVVFFHPVVADEESHFGRWRGG